MHRPATRRFVMWSLDVRSVRVVSSLLGSLSVSLARRAVVSRRVSRVASRRFSLKTCESCHLLGRQRRKEEDAYP